MKKTVFIKNAAILTGSSLILRFAGIVFKVWLAKKIGSEGIGLYQLVFSVYVLASTFATSGISTAVTRLVAEEMAVGTKKSTLKILKRAVELTLIIALFSAGIIYFGAEFIAKRFLGDIRAVNSIKILPLSLPFIGITACFRGYFIARRKVTPNAVCQIAEQIFRIALILLFLNTFSQTISGSCFAVMLGDSCAEIISMALLLIQYLFDVKTIKSDGGEKSGRPVLRQILHIAVPITSGRYLNTLLRTAENVLVPKNLAKFKFSKENALSQFGMIKGMALPILFFPSAILNSVSTLLIPEISEAVTNKNRHTIKSASEKIIKLTLLCGILCSVLFFFGGERIGFLIYHDQNVGFLLKALSPIVPLMYLDSICDGILKGLDQQSFTFRTAVSDSSIRIILILLILPKTGINGFILIMYFSNLLTCILNVGRLIKISGAKIKISADLLLPLLSAATAVTIPHTFLRIMEIQNNLVYIIFLTMVSVAIYAAVLYYLEIIPRKPVKTAIKRVKNH